LIRVEIGRGTSGTVYRAWDERLARPVALKLFDPITGSRSGLDEGRVLARLDHPHIVRIFGADTHDGTSGIWMELLEGETLDDALDRDGVFGEEDALLIGLDLAAALTAVHGAGLLHRDVKGRNVLRERNGRIVLMDLGAARAAEGAGPEAFEAGTPLYMAPEVLAGGSSTVRSDLYSLGVLLHRLLTGTFPVTAHDIQSLREAHLRRDGATLESMRDDLNPGTVTAIHRACAFDPESRHQSALGCESALAAALQSVLESKAVVASPAARAWALRGNAVVALFIVLTVAAASVWASWGTAPGRALRRSAGLTVPPGSPLYITVNGGIGILRGDTLQLVAHNPTTAIVLAASSDMGILTMAGVPPWTPGGRFLLDGTPLTAPVPPTRGICCFYDGTTDGEFNYAVREDSTLLEPLGSRSLAPDALYRFARDWSNPQQAFLLGDGGQYMGVAYDATRRSFWLTRNVAGAAVIEQWSPEGRHVSTPVTLPAVALAGIAVDPRDGTMWVTSQRWAASVIRLINFDASGRHLTSFEIEHSLPDLGWAGLEFAWPAER
jgi:Protein kinase domain